MITLLKLGGSLITDKKERASFRASVMQRLASEIQSARQSNPSLQLVIGHGSGSFGHFEASEHGTIDGVHTHEDWRGFARVATVAAQLNDLVTQALSQADVPIFSIQPSASVLAEDGIIKQMALHPLQAALEHHLVPLIYGDVALDSVRGGTITSTETIFTYLVQQLPVSRLLLPGEVDGVYDTEGHLIPEITPENFPSISPALQGASGVDVTGGMFSKVRDMLTLTQQYPAIHIQIFNGTVAGLVEKALIGEDIHGTMIFSAQE